VVATLVGKQLHDESVYTDHMRLKGLSLRREIEQAGAAMDQTVGDLMNAPVPPLRENTPFHEIAGRFMANHNNFFPVVNARQQLIGVVALQDLKEFLNDSRGMDGIIAYDVMRPPPRCLTPDQRLVDALPVLLQCELRNVPVINSTTENQLVGSLSRAEALAIFSEAIAEKSKPTG